MATSLSRTPPRKNATATAVPLYARVREILDVARFNVARTVNTSQVAANWLIGREIVEEEQRGQRRAGYGAKILSDLSARLNMEFGRGYSVDNLEVFRQFYIDYPRLISVTASRNSSLPPVLLPDSNSETLSRKSDVEGEWEPGLLDALKDPLVIEFLGLPESPRLVESALEQALIDLKVGKLTHGDLGQIQFCVNFYDGERRTEGDNPTLGLILCPDKNDAVVRYTLGEQQERNIFTSRYQLHLPTEQELESELRRELRQLSAAVPRLAPSSKTAKRVKS
ncbi:PDDEXK nuclease domain-containing protein [Variovorax robiniae]|uniref:PDDEXK nuclease domain-containing protein n=1 Tax=Variovorax robiniae TaxID=1836199 RepID=A0ABU8X533_9BURK